MTQPSSCRRRDRTRRLHPKRPSGLSVRTRNAMVFAGVALVWFVFDALTKRFFNASPWESISQVLSRMSSSSRSCITRVPRGECSADRRSRSACSRSLCAPC